MVYDARILEEYRDVLLRPRLKLRPEAVRMFLEGMRAHLLVDPVPLVVAAPDPSDLIFVEAALASSSKTIITGNIADYPETILFGARVISPASALAELGQP
jgi:predicted nucleic acid-binding protein